MFPCQDGVIEIFSSPTEVNRVNEDQRLVSGRNELYTVRIKNGTLTLSVNMVGSQQVCKAFRRILLFSLPKS